MNLYNVRHIDGRTNVAITSQELRSLAMAGELNPQDTIERVGTGEAHPASKYRQLIPFMTGSHEEGGQSTHQEEGVKPLMDQLISDTADMSLEVGRNPEYVTELKSHTARWFTALTLIVLAGVIPVAKLLVDSIGADASGLSISILAFFLLGLVMSFKTALGIQKDVMCARNTSGTKDSTPPQKPRSDFEKSMQAGRFMRVSSEVYTSRKSAKITVNRIAANTLVSLGLVGTVAGLIGSMSGISGILETIDTNNTDQLAAGFSETMGGLSTAFFTTLVGALLGGVLLRVLDGINTSGAQEVASEITVLTELNQDPPQQSDKGVADEDVQKTLLGIQECSEEARHQHQLFMQELRDLANEANGSIRRVCQSADEASQKLQDFSRAQLATRTTEAIEHLSRAAESLKQQGNPE